MARDDYGMPGLAALNSPYGLPTAPSINAPPQLMEIIARAQRMPQSRPVLLLTQSGGAGMPQASNVVPIQPRSEYVTKLQPGEPGAVPLVGKDLSLQQIVEIQRKAESGNNYQALNKQKAGNTASGAYQYTDSTWNNYGGYPKALLAPKEIQDRRFAEDVAQRVERYNGDMFKALASHYLPAFAGDPSKWNTAQRIKVKGGYTTVEPVANYLRQVLRDTPYKKQLEDYLNAN